MSRMVWAQPQHAVSELTMEQGPAAASAGAASKVLGPEVKWTSMHGAGLAPTSPVWSPAPRTCLHQPGRPGTLPLTSAPAEGAPTCCSRGQARAPSG